MQRNKYIKIIIFSSVALFGVIITQAYSYYKSYKTASALYDEHIQLSLHELGKIINKKQILKAEDKEIRISAVAKTHLIQNNEISDYKLAILKLNNDSIIYNNTKASKEEIKQFKYYDHQYCRDGDISIHLQVLNEEKYYLPSIIIWMVVSLVFVILFTIAFVISVKSSLNHQRLSSLKNNFINNMSHEIKTPVSTITVASQMLLRDEILDNKMKTKRYAEIISKENSRLRNLIDKVLQIAIFDKKKPHLKIEKTDIHYLINEIAAPFDIIIKQKNGKFVLNLNAENSILNIDKSHMSNVISNLLDNAIKYSPDERLEIRVNTYNKNSSFILEFEDRGIGIPEEERENVFEKFHRINSGNKHDVKGFGVGLYYVKQVINSMNGKLEIIDNQTTNRKYGTKFRIIINNIYE